MTITAQAVLSHWKWPAVWNASSWSLSATDRDGDKSAGCGQLTLVLQTEKPNLQQSLTITRRCISQNFANYRKQCRNKLYNKSRTNTPVYPFNGSFSGTTQVSRYQKGKTNLDFTEARDSEWQWHQLELGHMQVSTLLQTDNHISTPPLSFLQAGCPSCRPTNSVKALKE